MLKEKQISPQNTDMLSLVPTVYTDGELRIVSMNEAAAQVGIRTNETVRVRIERDAERFRHWYEMCTDLLRTASYDTLHTAGQPVRLPLRGFHGFGIAVVRYEHSLAGSFAAVMLFRSMKEFLSCAPLLTDQSEHAAHMFFSHFHRLREHLTELLRSPDVPREALAEQIGDLMAAMSLSARLLSPLTAESTKEKRIFSVFSLLDGYLSSVLPHLSFVDCHIEHIRTGLDEDWHMPIDASVLFLLFSVLVSILNEVSADGCIRIEESRYGQDGEIRFSAKTKRQMPPYSHLSALSSLEAALPQMKMQLSAADYLAGITDSYLDVFTDKEASRLGISLYLPFEKKTNDFKSPRGADEDVREACRCMRGLFSEHARLFQDDQ